MNAQIRRLSVGDVSAYRNIRLEALKTFPEAYGDSYGEAVQRPPDSFTEILEASKMFGAFSNEQLCGIACFLAQTGERNRHIGYLYQMYVRPQHQGTGMGMALIEAVLNCAKSSVRQIHLGVGTENRAALVLYKKAGFEIYGTEPRALVVDGRYIDEHLMVKIFDQKDE